MGAEHHECTLSQKRDRWKSCLKFVCVVICPERVAWFISWFWWGEDGRGCFLIRRNMRLRIFSQFWGEICFNIDEEWDEVFSDYDITHMLIGWVIKLQQHWRFLSLLLNYNNTGSSYPCLVSSPRERNSVLLTNGAAYSKHNQCFDLGWHFNWVYFVPKQKHKSWLRLVS